LAAKYHKFWYTPEKRRQMDTIMELFLYGEMIPQCIKNTPCISPQLVEVYTLIAYFRADQHHIYIQEKKDPREEWV
jgi:hypothetical protein